MANANVRFRLQQQPKAKSNTNEDTLRDNEKNALKKKEPAGLALRHLVIIVLFVYCIFSVVRWRYYHVPVIQDSSDYGVGDYSEERARIHLNSLVDMGPRVTGSKENEVLAFNYLMNELQVIQKSTKPHLEVEIDVQRPTGSYKLDFLGGFTHYYANVTNIVARISATGKDSKHNALLINCHFDSVIDSPGASDDAVSCATMLEILRAIAQSDQLLQHGIVFLFNGAEESILQASHGFITQHKWRHTLRAFINLEAAGAGGRELVFQTGPQNPWLIRTYMQHAPHPFASTVGQEIFETAIIPSDTDFRIFRDYGKIPGMDLAYITNGYVYHTLYDNVIPTGCMQRTGENVLATVRALVCTDELVHPSYSRHGKIVFTDFLGYFIILYPERLGMILNYSISIITLVVISIRYLPRLQSRISAADVNKPNFHHLLFATGMHSLSWLAGLVTAPIIGFCILLLDKQLSWYNHGIVMVPLYVFPTILSSAAAHYYGNRLFHRNTGLPSRPLISWHLQQAVVDVNLLFWSIITIFLTYNGIASAFLTLTWILSPLIVDKFLWHFMLQQYYSNSPLAYLLMQLTALSLPTTLMTYLGWGVFDFFIPVLGRCGPLIPAEIILAALAGIFTQILFSSIVNLVHVLKDFKWCTRILASSFIACFILVGTGVIFPYSGPPQPRSERLLYQHVRRQFRNTQGVITHVDSGIVFTPMDANRLNYIAKHHSYFKDIKRSPCRGTYCGYPAYYPMRHLLGRGWYKETPPLEVPKETKLTLIKKEVLDNGSRYKLFLSIEDPPAQIRLLLEPANYSQLAAWSFTDEKPHMLWNGVHYTAFVFYTRGPSPPSWQFWVEMEITEKRPEIDHILSIGVVTHFGNVKSAEIQEIDKIIPSWVVPTSCVSEYNDWQF